MEKRTVNVKLKNIAQSAQKLRLVVDLVRGMDVTKALATLRFTNRKGAKLVAKSIESAVANAQDKYGIDRDMLKITEAFVDEAKTMKTGRFVSRGRFTRIFKRRSHLNLRLSEK